MQRPEKFQVAHLRWFQWLLLLLAGVGELLLLARMLARALAARPDNPTIRVLYQLTEPLRLPLAILDTSQPRFGAILEFATLTLAIFVPVLAYIAWWIVRPRSL